MGLLSTPNRLAIRSSIFGRQAIVNYCVYTGRLSHGEGLAAGKACIGKESTAARR